MLTHKQFFKGVLFGSLISILAACGGSEEGGIDLGNNNSITQDPGNSGNPVGGGTQPPTSEPGSATLTWLPPTENVDGTALTDLAGYIIYYGTEPGNYPNTITINNPGLSEYVIDNLPGNNTYYFVITAFDAQGKVSNFSNMASKTLT